MILQYETFCDQNGIFCDLKMFLEQCFVTSFRIKNMFLALKIKVRTIFLRVMLQIGRGLQIETERTYKFQRTSRGSF
jgi:hypothetical protein